MTASTELLLKGDLKWNVKGVMNCDEKQTFLKGSSYCYI